MQKINIVFGSVYGSAHFIATELGKVLEKAGHSIELFEQPTLPLLNPAYPLLIVTSTTGDGKLPMRLQPLLQDLQRPNTQTPNLKYALIALGDSTYPHYCGGGRALAHALEHCGAQALAPALELDACHCLNPEDEALPWALKLIEENT